MYRIFGPKGHLIVRSATLARVKQILAGLRRRFGKVRVVNLSAAKPFTMYDSVSLTEIPRDAVAVAGYVNGRWTTYPKLAALFPRAHRLSIAVSAEADADCLDVEPRDAYNAQAPDWFRRQKQLRPGHKPKLYTSLSNVMTLVGVLNAAGIRLDEYEIWSAHYTHTPHRCGPSCGYGLTFTVAATQYTDKALGKNLDASLCAPHFLP